MLGSPVIMTMVKGRRIRVSTLAGAAALAVVFGSACNDAGEDGGGEDGGGGVVEDGGGYNDNDSGDDSDGGDDNGGGN